MKKILIPIDFKFNSHDAIDYAIRFFKREQCEFYFLNTYTYDISGLNTIDLLQADDDWYDKPKCASEDNLGYCIRTGKKIPFNLEKPYTDKSYAIWSKWKDITYEEKFCHFTGETSDGETCFHTPILRKNWAAAKKKHNL